MSINLNNLNENVSPISICPLQESEMEVAIALVADTMASNPLHQAIFNEPARKAFKKQRGMFDKALRMKTNHLYAAKINGEIAGVMCYTSSEYCQLKPFQLAGMLPSLWTILGKALPKVLAWRLNWKKHDYEQPHIHFGPIAVDRNFQGRGIGTALLNFFCDKMNETGQVAYLETDKEVNLTLYTRFGFEVIKTDMLFGVKNWFMIRKPFNTSLQA